MNGPADDSRHHTIGWLPDWSGCRRSQSAWPAVALESPAQETLGSSEVAPLAEPELDRVTITVDGPIQIFPLSSDFDVRFIDVPLPGNSSLSSIEAPQKFGRVPNDPSVNGRMVDRDAALRHHLLQISEAQIVSQIPPDAEQDHGSIKMPALEHLFLRH